MDTFDVVMTEFVSQFLDQNNAFREFVRVLNLGGYTGINELCKDEDIPQKEVEELMMVEEIFGEITQLPFKVHTPDAAETLA
ncbi:MAG: hypothetical protein JXA38_02380 [Methanosarcinaceae archaeon]|nr:hypothetical protein [Methanosarcinaceae archaeon]